MKYIFFTSLLFFSEILFAQSFLVEYDVLNSNKIVKTELIINDTFSLYNVQNSNSNNTTEEGFLVKNKNSNLVFSTDRFMSIRFYVKDSLDNMKWQLTSDTTTILNQKCLSAKTSFRGRDYIAYYSPNYQISEGPWKFGGLPGLILSVKSLDGYVEWKGSKIINNYSNRASLFNVNKYDFLSWNDFVASYKATVDKFIKLVRSSGKLDNEAQGELKIESVEIFYPELQTGKGIKF